MSMMSGNGARLSAVTRQLANRWQETRAHWRDAKSGEFQRHYLEELFGSVDKAVTVIEQVDKLLGKIKKDCE